MNLPREFDGFSSAKAVAEHTSIHDAAGIVEKLRQDDVTKRLFTESPFSDYQLMGSSAIFLDGYPYHSLTMTNSAVDLEEKIESIDRLEMVRRILEHIPEKLMYVHGMEQYGASDLPIFTGEYAYMTLKRMYKRLQIYFASDRRVQAEESVTSTESFGNEPFCASCGAKCPDFDLLDLHITEFHDPFFAGTRNGQRFRCPEASCQEFFASPEERIVHAAYSHGLMPDHQMFKLLR